MAIETRLVLARSAAELRYVTLHYAATQCRRVSGGFSLATFTAVDKRPPQKHTRELKLTTDREGAKFIGVKLINKAVLAHDLKVDLG